MALNADRQPFMDQAIIKALVYGPHDLIDELLNPPMHLVSKICMNESCKEIQMYSSLKRVCQKCRGDLQLFKHFLAELDADPESPRQKRPYFKAKRMMIYDVNGVIEGLRREP